MFGRIGVGLKELLNVYVFVGLWAGQSHMNHNLTAWSAAVAAKCCIFL